MDGIILIVLCIFLLVFIVLLIMGNKLFRIVFDRNYDLPTQDGNDNFLMQPTGKELEEFNKDKQLNYQQLNFKTLTIKSFDNLTLYANYLEGENNNVTVICVHGYRSSPIVDFAAIIEMYLKRKYNILLVENRGHLRSEGRYIGFGELDRFDIAKWVDKIKEINSSTNIFLHGTSMGAAIVTHTANMNLDIKGIIADSGFTSILDITKYLIKDLFKIPYFPLGQMARLNALIFAKTSFNKTNSINCVRNSNVPIAFISGKNDCFVPYTMTVKTYEACVSKKYLLLVEDTGHVASYMKDTSGYEKIVDTLISEALFNR